VTSTDLPVQEVMAEEQKVVEKQRVVILDDPL
jgi:hypothetical protein